MRRKEKGTQEEGTGRGKGTGPRKGDGEMGVTGGTG